MNEWEKHTNLPTVNMIRSIGANENNMNGISLQIKTYY